jgi:putative inorganic carbon (hco3(-)) transporter
LKSQAAGFPAGLCETVARYLLSREVMLSLPTMPTGSVAPQTTSMSTSSETTRDRFAFGALVAFSIVAYAVPAEWIPATQAIRPALVTSALAAGLFILRRLGRREAIHWDGVRGVSLLALTGLAFASSAWAVFPEAVTTVTVELVKLTAIYLTIVNIVNTPRRMRTLALAILCASAVASIGVIQWYLAGVDLVEGFRARWVGVFADPNIMAKYLGLIVPISAAFVVHKENTFLTRLAAAVSGVLAVVAIVFSHSRGGFIGLALGMAFWTFRERNFVRTLLIALCLGIALAFAPSSFWERTDTVASYQTDASAQGRINAWTVTSEINTAKPILGVGFGNFRYAWPIYAPAEARTAYMAHNAFLQVLAELGLLGFFLYLAFVGGSIHGAVEASNDSRIGWLARGLAAASVSYLVCDLFAGEVTATHGFMLYGLCAAASWVSRSSNPTEERLPPTREPPGDLIPIPVTTR